MFLAKGAASVASTATKLATGGEALQDGGPVSKLDTFLTTLVTYPFLHMAASTPSGFNVSTAGEVPSATADKVQGADRLTPPLSKTTHVVTPELGGTLSDYAEGKALVNLERWCDAPVLSSWSHYAVFRLRQLLLRTLDTLQLAATKTPPDLQHIQYAVGVVDTRLLTEASKWAVWGLQLWIRALDVWLGPRAPPVTVEQLVTQQLQQWSGTSLPPVTDISPAGSKTSGLSAPTPIASVTAVVSPNIRFITQELQRKYTLSRNKTIMEWLNVLLGFVRMWLSGVALVFYLLATGLRVLGNGLSAIGGLVAFTVVFSIAISVLSALTFLAASASEAFGTLLEYMARFTDLANRGASRSRVFQQQLQGKLGPVSLSNLRFEDLDEFFAYQIVSPRPGAGLPGRGAAVPGGMGGLRSRPDVPRLAHDTLLVTCYDAGLVDASGALHASCSVEDVADRCWDASGFFAHSSSFTRRAGAVLLLRLLCWKHIAGIMTPPVAAGVSSETERALRFVFVASLPGAGGTTLYRAITGMPQQYKAAMGAEVGEMRPVLRHRSSYALLCPPARKDTRASWVTQPRHGIISCLVFVVGADTDPDQVCAGNGREVRSTEQQALQHVWAALELRRPVLVAVNKASQVQHKLQNETTKSSEQVALKWRACLKELAAARGLESEYLTVMLTELLEVPPAGAVGLAQVQDWLLQALGNAPQQRA